MRGFLVIAVVVMVGCSSSPPSSPSVGPPGAVTITGNEKLGWDQAAADQDELSTIGFEIYVDGSPSTLAGVACGINASTAGFECKAPLPKMSPGSHALQLASFYLTSPDNKSALAGPLNVTVSTSIVDIGSLAPARSRPQGRPTSDVASFAFPAGAQELARGLDRPADLAFTPDNRLFIAERSGRVRVFHDAALLDEPALTMPPESAGDGAVLALAVDPSFERTRFVYAVYTALSRAGGLVFTLARFREAGDTLADRIVLLDNVPASADPRAALRFGPDGKLYVAFDAGVDPRLVEDLASFNGKVLRLNADGTTPDDAPRKSPILLEGLLSPRGLAWQDATRYLWTATESYVGGVRWTSAPNALAVAGDALFVGSEAGLIRATLDARQPGRIAGAVDLFRGGPVRALTIRPDGAVVFATADAIGVLNR